MLWLVGMPIIMEGQEFTMRTDWRSSAFIVGM